LFGSACSRAVAIAGFGSDRDTPAVNRHAIPLCPRLGSPFRSEGVRKVRARPDDEIQAVNIAADLATCHVPRATSAIQRRSAAHRCSRRNELRLFGGTRADQLHRQLPA